MLRTRWISAVIAALLLAPAVSSEESTPDAELSARQIYDKALQRDLETAFTRWRIVSTDPSGEAQESTISVWWRAFQDPDVKGEEGVSSKAVFRYTTPFDVRNLSILYIENRSNDDITYMFSPSSKKVKRVLLSGVNLFAADFRLDDPLTFARRELADARLARLADENLGGRDCYVIEILGDPEPAKLGEELEEGLEVETDLQRSRIYIDKQTLVPLKTRYWNQAGVLTREQTTPAEAIQMIDGFWTPTATHMHNLRENTRSSLHVQEFQPNPKLRDTQFTTSWLSRVR